MTERKIYSLAWHQAISDWSKWHDKLEKRPDSEICQYREKEAWRTLKEIEEIIHEKGLTAQID